MKKILFATLITLHSLTLFAKDECWTHYSLPNNTPIGFDTLLSTTGIINIPVKAYITSNGCRCGTLRYSSMFWNRQTYIYPIISGDTAYYIITDTGSYAINVGIQCGIDIGSDYFLINVHYLATPVNEIPGGTVFRVFPTLSESVFNLQIDDLFQVKKIYVEDPLGRIVFLANEKISQFDLSSFATGWYVCILEDRYGTIYRRKIIKV